MQEKEFSCGKENKSRVSLKERSKNMAPVVRTLQGGPQDMSVFFSPNCPPGYPSRPKLQPGPQHLALHSPRTLRNVFSFIPHRRAHTLATGCSLVFTSRLRAGGPIHLVEAGAEFLGGKGYLRERALLCAPLKSCTHYHLCPAHILEEFSVFSGFSSVSPTRSGTSQVEMLSSSCLHPTPSPGSGKQKVLDECLKDRTALMKAVSVLKQKPNGQEYHRHPRIYPGEGQVAQVGSYPSTRLLERAGTH